MSDDLGTIGRRTMHLLPREVVDVAPIVRTCAERRVRTAVASDPSDAHVPEGTVVLDLRALDRITIDASLRRVRAEVGCRLDLLRRRVADAGFTLDGGPAFDYGGTLGDALASGWFVSRSGDLRTQTPLEALDVVTADGELLSLGPLAGPAFHTALQRNGRLGQLAAALADLIDRYAAAVRDRESALGWLVAGYNLAALLPENGFHLARSLLGSRNALAFPLVAECALSERPRFHAFAAFGFRDAVEAARSAPFAGSYDPVALFGFDEPFALRLRALADSPRALPFELPPAGGWLVAEFGAESQRAADDTAESLCEAFKRRVDPVSVQLISGPVPALLWTHAGQGTLAFAIPVESLAKFLEAFAKLSGGDRYSVHGDFGLAYVGIELARCDEELLTRAAETAAKHGGALAVGEPRAIDRKGLWRTMYGSEIAHASEEIERVWNPDGVIVEGPLGGPGTRNDAAPAR